jgi:hypothetical protein
MGAIYATHVAVCVGSHANDSEYLKKVLGRKASALSQLYRRLLKRSNSELDWYESTQEGWSADTPKLKDPLYQSRCLLAVRSRVRRRLAMASSMGPAGAIPSERSNTLLWFEQAAIWVPPDLTAHGSY